MTDSDSTHHFPQRSKRNLWLSIAVLVIIGGVGFYFFGQRCHSSSEFFGSEVWKLAMTSDSVDVVLLETFSKSADNRPSEFRMGKSIGGVTRSNAVVPMADWLIRLRAQLNDLNHCEHLFLSMTKRCLPVPGVAVRFTGKQNETAVLLVCFECDMLSIAMADDEPRWEDFDTLHGELLRLARELFPDDEALANLN